METVTEGVDSLFGARLLFISACAAEGSIKTVFIQRLLQAFGFHDVGMFGAAMNERVDTHRHPFRVFMHQQFATIGFSGAVTEFIHLTEFPAGIHVQQRKRQRTRIERFTRQVQHHAGIFADGIHHHRIREFCGNFTNDMDAFRLQLSQVSESFLIHNLSLSGLTAQACYYGLRART